MRAALAAVVLLLSAPAAALADPALVAVDTFAAPVHVSGPDGDAARVFVVEKEGRVQLVVNGARQPTPFLDVTGITDATGERGLLSIAFAPDYATSGLFYVFLTGTQAASPSGVIGDLMVYEGRRSAADPNVADPTALRRVFAIPHPGASNHNGGQLAFGPDGLLYVSTGDGGVSAANAQDPGSLLGKILRIDPRTQSTPQVWALGLRNPWRFSFDRITGEMIIGDVGNGAREEVDVAPAGVAGRNYGWPACEGDIPTPCSIPGAVAPVLALPHDAYRSVVGGVVVRDPGLPTLLGRHVFGDHFQTTVLSARVDGGDFRTEAALPVASASAVSEDGCGHVHVVSLDGPVARIQDGATTGRACCRSGPPRPARRRRAAGRRPRPTRPSRASGPAPPSGCAAAACKLTLTADEAATATLRAKRFRTRQVALQAGTPRVVRLQATRRGLRKLRRALRQGRRPEVSVRVAVRDAAGNLRVRRVTVRLRPR